MVKAAENRSRNDVAFSLDTPTDRGVTVQRLMRSRLVVVAHVLDQRFQQVRLAHRDRVVGALSPERSDDALDGRWCTNRPDLDLVRTDSHAVRPEQSKPAR